MTTKRPTRNATTLARYHDTADVLRDGIRRKRRNDMAIPSELTEYEKRRLNRVRERSRPLLTLNCEVFDLIIDTIIDGHMELHFRGIDGRAYHGVMLDGDVRRLRDLLLSHLEQ